MSFNTSTAFRTWKPLTGWHPRPLMKALVVRVLVRTAFRVDEDLARNLCKWVDR